MEGGWGDIRRLPGDGTSKGVTPRGGRGHPLAGQDNNTTLAHFAQRPRASRPRGDPMLVDIPYVPDSVSGQDYTARRTTILLLLYHYVGTLRRQYLQRRRRRPLRSASVVRIDRERTGGGGGLTYALRPSSDDPPQSADNLFRAARYWKSNHSIPYRFQRPGTGTLIAC